MVFKENIRKILSRKGLVIAEFSENIGEKVSRVNDVLNGKQCLPFDMVGKILIKFDINANWLVTKKNSSDLGTINDGNYSEPADYVYIPMYNAAISVGNGAVTYGEAEPTISNNNTLLVDTSKTNLSDGSIYVICSSDVLWVKRIQRQINGSLLLISDNQTYPLCRPLYPTILTYRSSGK